MSTGPVNRQIAILLVEDNPGDVRLTEEVIKESGLPVRLFGAAGKAAS